MIFSEMISLHRKFFSRSLQAGIRRISTSHALRKSHYETLGVKQDASQADIKNAYFELSKIYHPDRIAATDENLAKFREISAAYEVLGNEQSRKLYDRGLLRDSGKVGIDQPEDPSDPIIRFYRDRQHRHKVPTYGKPEGEMDVWTKTFYKQSRTKTFAKNELFKSTIPTVETQNFIDMYALMFYIAIAAIFLFLSNFKNHPAEKALNNLKSKFVTS